MVVQTETIIKSGQKSMENVVRSVLLRAQIEKRITVGLLNAVKTLTKTPDDALFCVIASPKTGDTATHMHEILLEAFCYENDIYVIKVDDAAKLSRILGCELLESCALVHKTWSSKTTDTVTTTEEKLIDYCEDCWDATIKPIIRLPD